MYVGENIRQYRRNGMIKHNQSLPQKFSLNHYYPNLFIILSAFILIFIKIIPTTNAHNLDQLHDGLIVQLQESESNIKNIHNNTNNNTDNNTHNNTNNSITNTTDQINQESINFNDYKNNMNDVDKISAKYVDRISAKYVDQISANHVDQISAKHVDKISAKHHDTVFSSDLPFRTKLFVTHSTPVTNRAFIVVEIEGIGGHSTSDPERSFFDRFTRLKLYPRQDPEGVKFSNSLLHIYTNSIRDIDQFVPFPLNPWLLPNLDVALNLPAFNHMAIQIETNYFNTNNSPPDLELQLEFHKRGTGEGDEGKETMTWTFRSIEKTSQLPHVLSEVHLNTVMLPRIQHFQPSKSDFINKNDQFDANIRKGRFYCIISNLQKFQSFTIEQQKPTKPQLHLKFSIIPPYFITKMIEPLDNIINAHWSLERSPSLYINKRIPESEEKQLYYQRKPFCLLNAETPILITPDSLTDNEFSLDIDLERFFPELIQSDFNDFAFQPLSITCYHFYISSFAQFVPLSIVDSPRYDPNSLLMVNVHSQYSWFENKTQKTTFSDGFVQDVDVSGTYSNAHGTSDGVNVDINIKDIDNHNNGIDNNNNNNNNNNDNNNKKKNNNNERNNNNNNKKNNRDFFPHITPQISPLGAHRLSDDPDEEIKHTPMQNYTFSKISTDIFAPKLPELYHCYTIGTSATGIQHTRCQFNHIRHQKSPFDLSLAIIPPSLRDSYTITPSIERKIFYSQLISYDNTDKVLNLKQLRTLDELYYKDTNIVLFDQDANDVKNNEKKLKSNEKESTHFENEPKGSKYNDFITQQYGFSNVLSKMNRVLYKTDFDNINNSYEPSFQTRITDTLQYIHSSIFGNTKSHHSLQHYYNSNDNNDNNNVNTNVNGNNDLPVDSMVLSSSRSVLEGVYYQEVLPQTVFGSGIHADIFRVQPYTIFDPLSTQFDSPIVSNTQSTLLPRLHPSTVRTIRRWNPFELTIVDIITSGYTTPVAPIIAINVTKPVTNELNPSSRDSLSTFMPLVVNRFNPLVPSTKSTPIVITPTITTNSFSVRFSSKLTAGTEVSFSFPLRTWVIEMNVEDWAWKLDHFEQKTDPDDDDGGGGGGDDDDDVNTHKRKRVHWTRKQSINQRKHSDRLTGDDDSDNDDLKDLKRDWSCLTSKDEPIYDIQLSTLRGPSHNDIDKSQKIPYPHNFTKNKDDKHDPFKIVIESVYADAIHFKFYEDVEEFTCSNAFLLHHPQHPHGYHHHLFKLARKKFEKDHKSPSFQQGQLSSLPLTNFSDDELKQSGEKNLDNSGSEEQKPNNNNDNNNNNNNNSQEKNTTSEKIFYSQEDPPLVNIGTDGTNCREWDDKWAASAISVQGGIDHPRYWPPYGCDCTLLRVDIKEQDLSNQSSSDQPIQSMILLAAVRFERDQYEPDDFDWFSLIICVVIVLCVVGLIVLITLSLYQPRMCCQRNDPTLYWHKQKLLQDDIVYNELSKQDAAIIAEANKNNNFGFVQSDFVTSILDTTSSDSDCNNNSNNNKKKKNDIGHLDLFRSTTDNNNNNTNGSSSDDDDDDDALHDEQYNIRKRRYLHIMRRQHRQQVQHEEEVRKNENLQRDRVGRMNLHYTNNRRNNNNNNNKLAQQDELRLRNRNALHSNTTSPHSPLGDFESNPAIGFQQQRQQYRNQQHHQQTLYPSVTTSDSEQSM